MPAEKNPVRDQRPKLYALLVGINKYPAETVLPGGLGFRPLHGSVDDARKMKAYLESQKEFEVDARILLNEDATKKSISNLFIKHLAKAGPDDVVVFYYSGHGAQEKADKVWRSDTDGRLESIVCYYEDAEKPFLLADKELRWLLNQVYKNKPHILTIFDCCHSGEITRNGAVNIAAFDKAIEKKAPLTFPMREWKDFLFASEVDRESVLTGGEKLKLPEGVHIQMSACESDESAMEVAGEGVFTKALLYVLQTTEGNITYHALRSRVRQYLRTIFEQKPRIYVSGESEDLLYTNFLQRSSRGTSTFGEVIYNQRSGWLLNMGAIHGLGRKSDKLQLLDASTRQPVCQARIELIKTDYAEITPEKEIDEQKIYLAYLEGLLSQTMKIHIDNANGPTTDQEKLVEAILETGNLLLETEEGKADYVARCRNGWYYITRAGDPFRPLNEAVPISKPDAHFLISTRLEHMAKWEFVRNFTNDEAGSRLSANAVSIELQQVDNGVATSLPSGRDDLVLTYQLVDGQWQTGVKITVTNNLDIPVYCCIPYLSVWFGVHLNVTNPSVYRLEPHKPVEIPLLEVALINQLQEPVRLYNWPEQVEYLKFIFSTEEFDAAALALEELPPPLVETPHGEKGGFVLPKTKTVQRGWVTRLITLRFTNPSYNKISERELSDLVKDPVTTFFALGLYFNGQITDDLKEEYKIKPEIELVRAAEGKKGFAQDSIIDLANWWARRQRNRHYEEMVKRFPEKPRIVSEGDSWFQHPLVLDIIDHVCRLFPVYCVAAAGETLRNYASAQFKRGEYFLNAVEREQPAFFLISGGGNDILGSQFRNYLVDKPDNSLSEGEHPERFLKDSLEKELKDLMVIYQTLFGHFREHYPNITILVHGYDYPVKLDEKKKGWLGRYMIEKGIQRGGDRRAIIRHIMDTFNKMLEEVVAEFKGQVHYLNVRNLVKFDESNGLDQWYDEIHPNNEGFQLVAMRFIQQLDAIIKDKKMSASPE